MVSHETKSLYQNNCATCHGSNREGAPPTFPSLVDIGKRRSREDIIRFVREGGGRMPAFDYLERGVDEIVDYLLTGRDAESLNAAAAQADPNWQKYRNEGYILFRDPKLSAAHAALGHAQRHRSESRRDPLEDSVRRISGVSRTRN